MLTRARRKRKKKTTATSPPAAPKTKKRVVTSAVPGMTVAEVRKALDVIRKAWKGREAFRFGAEIPGGSSFESFAVDFILGHHLKRRRKR